MSSLSQRHEQTPDLYQSAYEVCFGEDGAQMAAEAGAAGSVAAIDDVLTGRDKRMLAIGALSGAAAAIARSRYPYEHAGGGLERADLVTDHARQVQTLDRNQQPLFDEGGEG